MHSSEAKLFVLVFQLQNLQPAECILKFWGTHCVVSSDKWMQKAVAIENEKYMLSVMHQNILESKSS
jgi:hypothetical protein